MIRQENPANGLIIQEDETIALNLSHRLPIIPGGGAIMKPGIAQRGFHMAVAQEMLYGQNRVVPQ
jgi:hypothetical protein